MSIPKEEQNISKQSNNFKNQNNQTIPKNVTRSEVLSETKIVKY